MFDVPVALFAYNRPRLTRHVWERIKRRQPARLLVVADGPASAADIERCEAVRALVGDVDWRCDADYLFAAEHMGNARRVSSGLAWVFGKVERAIILEDDTVPDPSFFGYCRELLARFEDEQSVMQIGGTNLAGSIAGDASYGFSKYTLPPWGWATWARAWRHYDFELSFWDSARRELQRRLDPHFPVWDAIVARYRESPLTWDVQWNATLWRFGALSVVPSVNLVSNIGWGDDATITRMSGSAFSNMVAGACALPLRHPLSFAASFDVVLEPCLFDLFADATRRSA
jgi:hypothetical protein